MTEPTGWWGDLACFGCNEKEGVHEALLTSAGIGIRNIDEAFVDLLSKPISESRALCIPTAMYPFPADLTRPAG